MVHAKGALKEMSNGTSKTDGVTNGMQSTPAEEYHNSKLTEGTGTAHRPMHARKESSPMAPPFIVSAPGKVIVYGEHAVVHGKVDLSD